MDFSKLEFEVIALRAITGALNDLVNRSILHFAGTDAETWVTFDSPVHQQLFNVLLVDFLENVDATIAGRNGSSLAVLHSICEAPMFDEEGSVEYLSRPVASLDRWLNADVIVESWFPSIDTNAELPLAPSGTGASPICQTLDNTLTHVFPWFADGFPRQNAMGAPFDLCRPGSLHCGRVFG